MPTLTAPSTVTFPLQIDQILTLTTNFGTGNVTLSAQKSGDIVYPYSGEQMQDSPVFSPGSQGLVTITHLTGSLTYNVSTSAFPLFENTPRVLFQSAIPFILAGGTATNQFTVNSAGLVTALPTLPITSGFAFFYLPSGVTGTAGWYYAQVQSATSVQLYTARYTSGDPKLAAPTTLVTQSTTAGNYSQTTGVDIQGPAFTLLGGSMGPNGTLRAYLAVSMTGSVNTKAYRLRFGTTGISGVSSAFSSNSTGGFGCVLQNVNSQSINKVFNGNSSFQPYSNSGGGFGYSSVNTAADQTVNFSLNISTASEMAMFEYYNVDLMYGA